MNAILNQLITDHHKYQTIYQCINRQMILLGVQTNRLAPIEIIYECMLFITDYPKKWHHPIETFMGQILAKKSIKYQPLIHTINHEHLVLESLTDQLMGQLENCLEQPISDNLCVPDGLVQDLEHYIQLQTFHAKEEEKKFFQFIEQSFDDTDWNILNERITEYKQPVFRKILTKQFERLYEQLLSHETLLMQHRAKAA